MKEKVIMCWSGGKDSAMALHALLQSDQYEVVSLLTTMTEGYDRISMHGVRRTLLEMQAQSIGLPLEMVYITQGANNQEYEEKMAQSLQKFKEKGISTVAFGDIFLEDLKVYRENNLKKIGMKGIFPIWKRSTTELAKKFVTDGFRAHVACIDTRKLADAFSGRSMDESFFNDLPSQVDPCGENGEFHSYVCAGPIFKNEIQLTTGEKVRKDPFLFCDLEPL